MHVLIGELSDGWPMPRVIPLETTPLSFWHKNLIKGLGTWLRQEVVINSKKKNEREIIGCGSE